MPYIDAGKWIEDWTSIQITKEVENKLSEEDEEEMEIVNKPKQQGHKPKGTRICDWCKTPYTYRKITDRFCDRNCSNRYHTNKKAMETKKLKERFEK